MSAFSPCNGPDNCGTSLPQVQTLEALLSQISTMQTQVSNALIAISDHAKLTDTAHTISALLKPISTSAQTALDNINAHEKDTNAHPTAAEKNAWDAKATTANVNKAQADATKTATDYTDTQVKGINTTLTGIRNDVNALETGKLAISSLSLGTLEMKLKTLEVMTVGFIKYLKTGAVRDFVEWRVTPGYWHAVNGLEPKDEWTATRLVAMLSEEWRDPPIGNDKFLLQHSGRCYIKINNTDNMSAIVDVSCAKKGTGFVGQIFVEACKSFTQDVRFGLYSGTDMSGKKHIYLGLMTLDRNSVMANPNSNYVIACDGLIPIDDLPAADRPNNNVTKLCHTRALAENSAATAGVFEADVILAQEMRVDKIATSEIVTLDKDGNVINIIRIDDDKLIIGDPNNPRDLLIYTKDRPTIVHEDKSAHKMAYLSDVSTSVYWQTAVDAVADTLAELNDPLGEYRVTVDASGDITMPNPTGIQRPGIYTSVSSVGVDGRLFKAGDVALLKNCGLVDTLVPDGKVNDDLTNTIVGTTIDVPVAAITELDYDRIRIGTIGTTAKNGTIVVDITGKHYGKIIARDSPVFGTFKILRLDDNLWQLAAHSYAVPGYARFNGASWTFDVADAIEVPRTFDGVIHDITYQWSGPVKTNRIIGGARYPFADTYTLWTAHHQDNETMLYDGKDWVHVSMLTVVVHPLPVPVGAIITWPQAYNSTPVGFLACDGQEVDKALYSDLYAIVGDTFGIPANQNNFVVPQQHNAAIRWSMTA